MVMVPIWLTAANCAVLYHPVLQKHQQKPDRIKLHKMSQLNQDKQQNSYSN